jgi:hypothetical protein
MVIFLYSQLERKFKIRDINMRKDIRILTAIIVFFFILCVQVQAGTGIGIIIGEPTGLSLKINNFPVLGIAWSFSERIHVNCDYWAVNDYLSGPMRWYLGLGGKFEFSDNYFGAGLRVPIGLRFFIAGPLEIFGEVVPTFNRIPN